MKGAEIKKKRGKEGRKEGAHDPLPLFLVFFLRLFTPTKDKKIITRILVERDKIEFRNRVQLRRAGRIHRSTEGAVDDNKYLYANLANKHCLLMIEDLGGRVVQAGSTNEFPWKRRDRLWDPGNGREGRKGEKEWNRGEGGGLGPIC